jgi:hypothetical protein
MNISRTALVIFTASLIANAAFASGHARYMIPAAPTNGLTKLDFPIEVLKYPDGFKDGYFFAYQYKLQHKIKAAEGRNGYNGFYIGIQRHENGNSAVCSYFGKGAHCVGGSAHGGADGMKGWSGSIKYPWEVGHKYTLHVEQVGQDKYEKIAADEVGWEGSIIDEKGQKTVIAVYAVSKELGNLHPSEGFWVEKYKNQTELPDIVVSFGAPVGHADGKTYPGVITNTEKAGNNQTWTCVGNPPTEAIIKSGPSEAKKPQKMP